MLFEDDMIIYPPKIQLLELMKESTSIFRYKTCEGTLLVIQQLRICLPMQGTQVQSRVWEDPPRCEAAKLLATATKAHAVACTPQQEKPLQ